MLRTGILNPAINSLLSRVRHTNNSDNPLPGMLHSLGYMKGVLAGMAG